MKTKLLTSLVVLLLVGAALFYMQSLVPQSVTTVQKEEATKTFLPFPNVIFSLPNGPTLHVNNMKEKVVLVHFWAAWCAVCYTEFPDLVKYVANSHGKVALLSVSLDDRYEDSQKALDKIATKNHISLQGSHLYWAWDKDKNISLKMFNTVKVPETIVLNEKRQMVDKIIGVGPWNEASMHQ